MSIFGTKRHDDKEVVLLCTLSDPFRTDILLGVLEENKIPYLRHEAGAGALRRNDADLLRADRNDRCRCGSGAKGTKRKMSGKRGDSPLFPVRACNAVRGLL